MQRILILTLLALSTSSFNLTRDNKKCTEEANGVVDALFKVIETFENDPLHPESQPVKDLLAALQTLLDDCFGMSVNLNQYDGCVDMVDSLFPQIDKLVQDIKGGDTTTIIGDVTALVLQIVNGVKKCTNPQTVVVQRA